MTAGRAVLVLGVLAAACGGPQGPDGQELPRIPAESDRHLQRPPLEVLATVIENVRERKDAAPDERTGSFPLRLPAGEVEVAWERTVDGCRITVRSEAGPPIVFTVARKTPADGPADAATVETITPESGFGHGREHWGPKQAFYAFAPDCDDVVWLQYVERRTRYFDDDDKEIATDGDGPEIDEQNPYRIQSQPALGTAWMQDDPGPTATTGTTAQAAAPGALAEIKRLDETQNNATKVIVVWRFWSYLFCANPRRVLGHLAWGFTVTIDVNSAPYIAVSDVTPPTWHPPSRR
ncbi:MAG: hypothetical protein F9K40_07790 [Kofleriaceae bacterium]|nr:MAG: hypothetical protein F9K40_07790 [Kofleriaceae bacterium]MBZ0236074.1 hypothetical protein [Kofleriaceae bacterium]